MVSAVPGLTFAMIVNPQHAGVLGKIGPYFPCWSWPVSFGMTAAFGFSHSCDAIFCCTPSLETSIQIAKSPQRDLEKTIGRGDFVPQCGVLRVGRSIFSDF